MVLPALSDQTFLVIQRHVFLREGPYATICVISVFNLIGALSRRARKDSVVRLQKPIHGRDGAIIREIYVPKGSDVWIGSYACGTSKTIWGEDALEWKPERWLSPLPNAVHEASFPGVYSHL